MQNTEITVPSSATDCKLTADTLADADFIEVVNAWGNLPPAVRKAILTMVKAVQP